ncbi:hypothetical protein [Nocardioides lentus]|uniref:hypothetical protein n=1 Tax=Nocardioides lentus TaxID=338077 RepID=UPI0031CEB62E
MGESSHELGGARAFDYPSRRPAFDCVDDAQRAVGSAAHAHWGAAAELHVEFALAQALRDANVDGHEGALTGWWESDSEGAVWALDACDCADGALAQLFSTGRN